MPFYRISILACPEYLSLYNYLHSSFWISLLIFYIVVSSNSEQFYLFRAMMLFILSNFRKEHYNTLQYTLQWILGHSLFLVPCIKKIFSVKYYLVYWGSESYFTIMWSNNYINHTFHCRWFGWWAVPVYVYPPGRLRETLVCTARASLRRALIP